MFRKNSRNGAPKPPGRKDTLPSIVTRDMNILGNIISDGNVDFDGTLDGNIRCDILTLRPNASVKGEITANAVFVYGRVRGLIRAKMVHFHASCHVEGIIMHEGIKIEDGAFVDGKFKRMDKPAAEEDDFEESGDSPRLLENLRLIS